MIKSSGKPFPTSQSYRPLFPSSGLSWSTSYSMSFVTPQSTVNPKPKCVNTLIRRVIDPGNILSSRTNLQPRSHRFWTLICVTRRPRIPCKSLFYKSHVDLSTQIWSPLTSLDSYVWTRSNRESTRTSVPSFALEDPYSIYTKLRRTLSSSVLQLRHLLHLLDFWSVSNSLRYNGREWFFDL